jgi:ribosomal protein S20
MSTAGADAVAETDATPAPVEGEEAAATDETTEGAPPAEPPVEGEQAAAEGEGAEKPEEKPEPDETELAALAEKYAKDLWATANRTMAAARRAEARVKQTQAENATLKGHLQTYASFVERMQKGDPTALAELGFKSVREYLDAVANHGEAKPETAETRVERLERELRERTEREAKEKHEALVAEQQKLVFDHIGTDKERWKYTGSKMGRDVLWQALGEYIRMHGDIDDHGVNAVADAVEAGLREDFGAPAYIPKVSAARPAAKAGAPVTATEKKNSGRTLNNGTGSGAPVTKELPLDPVERKRLVNEQLRAEGLL